MFARAVRKYLDLAVIRGADGRALLREAALDAARIDDPDARIPFSTLLAFQERCAAACGDPAFGLHAAEASPPRDYDVLGFAALNSATLGDAFRRVAAYFRIWQGGATLSLEEDGDEARLAYRVEGVPPDGCRQDVEHTLAALVLAGRTLTGRDWRPIETGFAHLAPPDAAAHGRVFGEVRFGAARNVVVFDASTLDWRVHGADPALCAIVDRHARQLLAALPAGDSVVDEVRGVLAGTLAEGVPELSAVARRLGRSERSLQRRLAEAGTSFRDVLDDVRHELAVQHVRRGDVAVCEVAFLLGYADETAFRRAFRRWTGEPPGRYRSG